MSAKTPIRTVFNDSNVATGLAEFQTGEFVPLSHGGIGAALSIGSAGQVLKVNSGATALEFGAVEAIVNIDGATDLTGQTLVASDKLLASDGGTEGRINLSQIDTLFTGTTQTLTNKTISGSSNTLSNIGNSSLSNSTVNFGGVSLALGASDTTPAFDLSDATSYPTSSLTGTITNAQLAGSIANSKLSNSTVTIGTTSIALGASNTTIAGISNLTAGGINITGNSITSADSSIIEMGEGLSITGNLTVSGNMTVSGSTTTLETTNSTITDKLIELGNGTSGTPSGDAGIVIERGSSNNAFIGFDESADKFIVGTGTFTGSTTGDLTITTGTLVGNLEGNVTGNVTGNADSATALETARTIAGQSFDGTGNITIASTDLSNTSAIALLTSSQTLTNKTISGSNNTLSNIGNSSLSNSSVNFGGVTVSLGASDTSPAFDLSDATNYPTSSLSGTITNAQLAGSIANAKLSNSSITIGDDSSTNFSVDLGGSFEIIGGSGITTAITSNRITLSTDGSIVTETSSDTLTNKTINSNANTLHIDLDDLGTFTGTLAEFNSGLQGDSFVSLTGTETLTNKTLTSPKINEDVAVTATATEINLLDGVTATTAELNFTDGVSSNIQTQLNTKASNAFAIAQAVALG
jgi:hypothetical protein